MKAGAQLQQRRDASSHRDPTARLPDDPGDDLQERALAGTVDADDAERFAALDLIVTPRSAWKLVCRTGAPGTSISTAR